MPYAPLHACSFPGCNVLVAGRRCQAHTEADRPSYSRLYATARWKRRRKDFLAERPLCECPACQRGVLRVREANVVDHRVPHRGDEALFYDESNWVPMAKRCHDQKTGRETAARARQWRATGM